MKIISKEKQPYFIRFDKGDEVIEGLKAFAKKEKMKSASFSGLGAAGEILLSFYNLKTKKYEDKPIKKDTEITSLSGNIAWLGKEPIVHCHGNFSDREMKVCGGHVKKLIVSATCEISLWAGSKKIMRKYDPETGLNLTV
jgi:predicted DNA-binding protein with PD1-like motif